MLTAENYGQGFLVDDELMGGVAPNPEKPGQFCAFVLRHTTGEYLGYEFFPELSSALAKLNQIKRPWIFEKIKQCGGGNCKGGNCGGGACNQSNSGGGCC